MRPETVEDDPEDVAAPHTAVGWWHETGQFPVIRGGDELRDWLYPNERQYWVPPRPLFVPQPPTVPFEWNGNGKRIAQGVIAASTVAAVAAGGILAPGAAAAVGSIATQATAQFPVITATTMQQAPAQAQAHTAATTSSGDSSYVVKEGDTLHDIAAHYGVATTSLIAANNFKNPDLILPGDKVTIPSGDAAQSVTIKVQGGDTVKSLAARYGVSTGSIVKANSLANPDLIVVGQSLAIPGGKAPAPATPAATTPASDTKSADPAPSITVKAKDGDTVAKLAGLYSVDANTIVKANKLADPNLIRVGQSLVIPGGKQPSGEGGAPAAPAAKQQAQAQPQPQAQAKDPAPAKPAAQPAPAPAPAPAPKPAPAPAQQSSGFVWPTKGTITQNFGPTSLSLEPAYQGYAHFHQGIDIANSMNTPIVAAAGGTVIFSGWSPYGYGNCVQIDLGNGLVTLYGHMATTPMVRVGQHVDQGQQIGKMGSTGASTGPHLHFAVQKSGTWVNPRNYLP